MAVNKVIYGGTTLIDLTDSTLTNASDLASGVTAYNRAGVKITGTANSGASWITLFNSTARVVSDSPNYLAINDFLETIVDGDVWKITWDGTPYTYAAQYISANGGTWYMGNPGVVGGTDDGTGATFFLYKRMSTQLAAVTTDSQGIITLKIEKQASTGATQHTLHFEFSDTTDTDVHVYYDDPFLDTIITAYNPTTYGSKTVTLAQLDGVTWYEPAAIPVGVQLIDFTRIKSGYVIDENDGSEVVSQWSCCCDYTLIDPTMTFSYIGYRWYCLVYYDASYNIVGVISMMGNDADIIDENDYAHGTLTPAKIPSTAAYVRISSYPTNPNDTNISLIRTE